MNKRMERGRRQTDTPEARARVLAAIAGGKTLTEAAHRVGVDVDTILRWRRRDPDFAAAWADAYELGTDLFEREMSRRALDRQDKDSARLLIELFRGRAKRWRLPDAAVGAGEAEFVREIDQPMDDAELWRRVEFLIERSKREGGGDGET